MEHIFSRVFMGTAVFRLLITTEVNDDSQVLKGEELWRALD